MDEAFWNAGTGSLISEDEMDELRYWWISSYITTHRSREWKEQRRIITDYKEAREAWNTLRATMTEEELYCIGQDLCVFEG